LLPLPAGIVLGKHSGRHALASQLRHLGYDLSKQEVDDLFKRFKVTADTLQQHACPGSPASLQALCETCL
jgi:isopropylmalate/homocitrate/citramalate synthase